MDRAKLTASILKRVEGGELTVDDLIERKERCEHLTKTERGRSYIGSDDPLGMAIHNRYLSTCDALEVLLERS